MSPHDRTSTQPDPATRTFGDQQEDAAAALNQLLLTLDLPGATPGDPHDVDQLVACRAALVDGVTERLLHLTGAGNGVGRFDITPMPLGREHITDRPAAVMEHLAAALPRRQPPPPGTLRGLSPVEALGQPATHATVEHWRHVAVGIIIGNQILDGAAEQPWLSEAAAAWYILGDLAVAIEAVTVLDAAYLEIGLLVDHSGPTDPGQGGQRVSTDRRSWNLEERRMAAAQVARMAGWYATTSTPDLAGLGSGHTDGPVRIVSQPADLIAGQRQLAHHLRHRRASNAFATNQPSMDAATLRAVTRSQIELLGQVQTYCGRTPRCRSLAVDFARYRDMLSDISEHSRGVFDAQRRRPNSRALWQQQEVSNAVRCISPNLNLNPRQLNELLAVTHDVVHNLAAATRHEITLGATNLRSAGRGLADERRPNARISQKHPLYLALTAVINAPAPIRGAHSAAFSERRRALLATLAATPTSRAPSPYRLNAPNRDRGPGR